jgi:hypothetical protein
MKCFVDDSYKAQTRLITDQIREPIWTNQFGMIR